MPEIKVTKNGVKIGCYEVCRRNSGIEIIKESDNQSSTVYYGLWWKAPVFPNIMQAVRFLKENWEILMPQ